MPYRNSKKYYDADGYAQANDWATLEKEIASAEFVLHEGNQLSWALLPVILAAIGLAALALYLH